MKNPFASVTTLGVIAATAALLVANQSKPTAVEKLVQNSLGAQATRSLASLEPGTESGTGPGTEPRFLPSPSPRVK